MSLKSYKGHVKYRAILPMFLKYLLGGRMCDRYLTCYVIIRIDYPQKFLPH